MLLAPGASDPAEHEITPARAVLESFFTQQRTARARESLARQLPGEGGRPPPSLAATDPGTKERKDAEKALQEHLGTWQSVQLGQDVFPVSAVEMGNVVPALLTPFRNADARLGLTDAQVSAIQDWVARGDLAAMQSHYVLRTLVKTADGKSHIMIARLVQWQPGMERPTADTLGPGGEAVTIEEFCREYGTLAARLRRSWGPAWTSAFGLHVRKSAGLYAGMHGGGVSSSLTPDRGFLPPYES